MSRAVPGGNPPGRQTKGGGPLTVYRSSHRARTGTLAAAPSWAFPRPARPRRSDSAPPRQQANWPVLVAGMSSQDRGPARPGSGLAGSGRSAVGHCGRGRGGARLRRNDRRRCPPPPGAGRACGQGGRWRQLGPVAHVVHLLYTTLVTCYTPHCPPATLHIVHLLYATLSTCYTPHCPPSMNPICWHVLRLEPQAGARAVFSRTETDRGASSSHRQRSLPPSTAL